MRALVLNKLNMEELAFYQGRNIVSVNNFGLVEEDIHMFQDLRQDLRAHYVANSPNPWYSNTFWLGFFPFLTAYWVTIRALLLLAPCLVQLLK